MRGVLALVVAASLALAQPITLQYWHINTEVFGLPALRELIRRFEAQNPGIKVEERYHANAYTGLLQNLQAALAAGNPPDMAQIGYLYTQYVAENFPFIPAEELDKRFSGGRWLRRYAPNIRQLGAVKGRIVGAPYSLSKHRHLLQRRPLPPGWTGPRPPPGHLGGVAPGSGGHQGQDGQVRLLPHLAGRQLGHRGLDSLQWGTAPRL
jgi:ABC-type glycerol-3-phosphate transport system substrate-binding protein